MNAFEEEKYKSVDSSVAQLMHPTTESAVAAPMDQRTVEALRVFLQDMTVTIQSLVNRHDLVSENCRIEGAEVQHPLSLALPSCSLRTPAAAVEVPSTRSYGGKMINVEGEPRACYRTTVCEQATCNQEVKSLKTEAAICQDWEPGAETQGVKSDNFEEENSRPMDVEMDEVNGRTRGRLDDEDSAGHQLDAETVDALRGFLEDMKKTIQDWSNRHQLLVQGHCISPRESGESMEITPPIVSSLFPWPSSAVPLSSGGLPCLEPNDQNTVAGLQAQPRREHGDASLVQSGQPDQEIMNTVLSDHRGGDMALLQSDRTHQANRVEPSHLEESVSQPPRPNQMTGSDEGKKKVENSSEHINCNASAVVRSLSQLHDCDASAAIQPTQINISEDHATEQFGHGGMTVEFPPQPNNRDVDGPPMPQPDQEAKIVESTDLKLQGSDNGECNDSITEVKADGSGNASAGVQHIINLPYQREVQVVQSPDWLPKGWTTEVKIRGTGNSAGAKDKYYFDPVSKRRFRSRKEVFCFLETGKLGRYKPRSKVKVDEEKAVKCKPAVSRRRNNKVQPPSLPVGCVSTTISSSPVPLPSGPTSVSASGIFSSVLLPYRPGQPSDWLVYESLSSLPVPVFEHFPYPEKDSTRPNGSRAPPHGPWFFNNSEKTWRHYPYKKGKRKAVDEDKDATNSQCSEEGLHVSETMQKHSVASTRNFC